MKSICPNKIQSLKEDFLLIDIREKFEFDTHKADSQNLINIPFSEIDENLEILPKNKLLILICNNGLRSETAMRYLMERNFENVTFVEGGLVKLQQNGMKILGSPPDFISHSLSLTKDCNS